MGGGYMIQEVIPRREFTPDVLIVVYLFEAEMTKHSASNMSLS